MSRWLFLTLILLASTAFSAIERVTYFVNDANGSPLLEVNDAGLVIAEAEYRPYGESQDAVRRTGREATIGYADSLNQQDGIQAMGVRLYAPELGRFVSPDPVGYLDKGMVHFGRYHYANNNPYRYVDPTGEWGVPQNVLNGSPSGWPWIQAMAAQGKADSIMYQAARNPVDIDLLKQHMLSNTTLGGVAAACSGVGACGASWVEKSLAESAPRGGVLAGAGAGASGGAYIDYSVSSDGIRALPGETASIAEASASLLIFRSSQRLEVSDRGIYRSVSFGLQWPPGLSVIGGFGVIY